MARTPIARTSVRDALDSAVIALKASGCDTPRLDAELLLAEAMGVTRVALITDPGRGLEPDQAWQFAEWARRRRGREPIAYILGRKGFRHIELRVDRRVLIPRPETEHLVEVALGLPLHATVVDVGTGSGAIALALKHERPDLRIIATDSSADAIDVARANAKALDLDIDLRHGDLLAPLSEPVDAVISNPPYVADGEAATLPRDVVGHEPAQALFAGRDGLAVIERLAPAAAAVGARFVALEIGATQAAAVTARLLAAGFTDAQVLPDLAGHDRVVTGRR